MRPTRTAAQASTNDSSAVSQKDTRSAAIDFDEALIADKDAEV
jgi:hypothetical protein